jgi:hypothetical protein
MHWILQIMAAVVLNPRHCQGSLQADSFVLGSNRVAKKRLSDRSRKSRACIDRIPAAAIYLVSTAVAVLLPLAVSAAATGFAFWRSVLRMTSRAAFCSWLADVLNSPKS